MSRIEALGLPIPRKLMAVKEEFNQILEQRKLQNLDQHLQQSLNTIYSKMLAQKKKVNLSQKSSRKRRARHSDYKTWIVNFAKPKKVFEPEIMNEIKGKVNIDRIIRLARPKHQPCPDTDAFVVAESAMKYVATERILNLAQPKQEKEDNVVYEIPRIEFPTNPEYASVKSAGIDNLACARKPRGKYFKVYVDVRCSYTPVSKGALRYQATAEIKKLAKAKQGEEQDLTDPFKVKKSALKKLPNKQQKIFNKMSTPIEWKVTPKFETN